MMDPLKNEVGQRVATETHPQLLVSVRDLFEARECLAHPIGVLDFKEPRSGALGAVPNDELLRFIHDPFVEKILASPSRPFQLSFAAGELRERMLEGTRLKDHVPSVVLQSFQFAKIGLQGCARISHWQSRWERYFAGNFLISPVMVAYLDNEACDAPTIKACLDLAQRHPRCRTLLLDTYTKSKDLFSWIDDDPLAQVIQSAKEAGLRCVVAGSVTLDSLDRVLAAQPDLVGLRGALCSGSRESKIDGEKVADFAKLVRISSLSKLKNSDAGAVSSNPNHGL